MKKFYFLSMFLFTAFMVNAQVEVTFSVDMNTEGASTDGIFISGDWMSEAGFADWTEPGTEAGVQLTDSNEDGVYTLTVMLPAGDYAYKYSNGTGWPNAEAGGDADNYQADLSGCNGVDNGFGGYNRTLSVPDETTFAPTTYEFNSCTPSSVVNTNDLSTITDVTIAPNPATDYININYANTNNATHDILVSSITGQVIKQFNSVSGNNLTVDTKDLAAGMYFITFRNDKGEQGSEKFIVR